MKEISLKKNGAKVAFYNPFTMEYKDNETVHKGLCKIDEKILGEYDLVMITASHSTVDYHMI